MRAYVCPGNNFWTRWALSQISSTLDYSAVSRSRSTVISISLPPFFPSPVPVNPPFPFLYFPFLFLSFLSLTPLASRLRFLFPLPSLEGPLRLLDRIQGHTRKQELINKYECWQHDDRIRFYNWCDAVLSLRHAWYCCFKAHCLTALSQLKRSLQHYCNLYKHFPTSWENCYYVNQATAFNSVVAWCPARVLGYSPILAIAFSIACPFTSN